MKNNANQIQHIVCAEFKKNIKIKSSRDLITKQAVAQLGEQLVPQLTHQDTSKYINSNSTLHSTQRCELGRVFLFIKEFIYRSLRAVKRWYLFYTNRHDNLATSCSQNRKGSSKEEPFLLPGLITSIHIWEGRVMACVCNIIQKRRMINFMQIGWEL